METDCALKQCRTKQNDATSFHKCFLMLLLQDWCESHVEFKHSGGKKSRQKKICAGRDPIWFLYSLFDNMWIRRTVNTFQTDTSVLVLPCTTRHDTLDADKASGVIPLAFTFHMDVFAALKKSHLRMLSFVLHIIWAQSIRVDWCIHQFVRYLPVPDSSFVQLLGRRCLRA